MLRFCSLLLLLIKINLNKINEENFTNTGFSGDR